MLYSDIINNGILVYKSQAGDKKLREWRIEERTCTVNFYKTEPLTEFDSIILRLIDSTESGKITREELGLTLGFDVADRVFTTEENEVIPEGEKKKVDVPKYIRLTGLGRKALEMNCKFSFYTGEKVIYNNMNMSDLAEDR